jgi:hypothetical protein
MLMISILLQSSSWGAVDVLLLIVAFIEMVVAVTTAVIGCKSMCCGQVAQSQLQVRVPYSPFYTQSTDHFLAAILTNTKSRSRFTLRLYQTVNGTIFLAHGEDYSKNYPIKRAGMV